MKRLSQIALVSVLLLAVASMAAAQARPPAPPAAAPVPVVRLGNFIEVGNDVWMHILATIDLRYTTIHNNDFEDRVRDRTASRNTMDTRMQGEGEYDGMWAILRFGADFRYQKSLTAQFLAEQRPNLDGNTVDGRKNLGNPGGTDVFGRAAGSENMSLHVDRAWIDYKFPGTPLRMRVGYDLWWVDQAGTVGDDDPRFAVYANFGDFDVMGAAVVQFESQRLGLENDNDDIYYTFSAGYTLKPHRFQLDLVYERDRFSGADTQTVGLRGAPLGFTGQKIDAVQIIGSWSGAIGPVRGLLQGSLVTGTARGGTGLPAALLAAGVRPGRDYDILAGSAIAYAEADLGVVRPFGLFLFGSADGDPTDNRLHGFTPLAHRDITLMTATPRLAHFDTSKVFAREYACPGRMQGLGTNPNLPSVAVANPGAPGLPRTPANVGIAALGTSPGIGFTECSHTVGNPFNDGLGNPSHLGLVTTYGNPGTLVIGAGLRVFPLKGHEITGRYIYRGMVNTNVLEIAFAPELAARGIRGIRRTQYHEIGGFWMWTLNPHFDIRLAGNIGIADGGWKDLAQLAICDRGGVIPAGRTYATSTRCSGNDPTLQAEVRFRARF